MTESRIIRTPGQGYRRLGLQGNAVIGSHLQMVSILRNRLGREHADFLARPEVDPESGDVDWYTPSGGTSRRVADLRESERAPIEGLAAQLTREILQLADKLKREGQSAELVGRMLELAMETPAGSWLYECQGKPVLVLWGHSGEQLVEAGIATSPSLKIKPVPPKAAATAPAPIEAPSVEAKMTAKASFSWREWLPLFKRALKFLLWFLLALALCSLVLFGLSSCVPGFQPPRGAAAPAVEAQIAALQARESALQAELDEARRKAALCVPDAPAAVRADEGLNLTDAALKSGDLAFLKGEWRLNSKLFAKGKPMSKSFSFDERGNGKVIVKREIDGASCTGPIKGRMDGDKLVVEGDSELDCGGGRSHTSQNFECQRDSKGKTACKGLNDGGGSYEMVIVRGSEATTEK